MRDRIVAAIEALFAAREAQLDEVLGSIAGLEESIKARLPDEGGVIINVNVARTVTLDRADLGALADAVSAAVADETLSLSADRATFLYYLCRLSQIDAGHLHEQAALLEHLINRVRVTLDDLGYDSARRKALAGAGPPNV